MEAIKGIVEEIVFKNEENGFIIAVVNSDDEYVYIKGYMPYLLEGESALFHGVYKSHPTYGEQFEVAHWEVLLPTATEDIRKYLASGIIKGIGPSLADRIVDAFQEKTFEIIQYNPDQLLEVQGIGLKKLTEIVDSFREQVEARDAVIFLQKHGLTVHQAIRVYKALGEQTKRIVSENPYKLASTVEGIGFKMADAIAKRMGVDPRSNYRIASGILYALSHFSGNGHVYAPMTDLIPYAGEMLAIEPDLIRAELYEMTMQQLVIQEIVKDQEVVYLPSMHYAENKVAAYIVSKLREEPIEIRLKVEEEIAEVESVRGIELATLQKEAIETSVHSGLSIITGGPGTGKTTIINGLIHIFEKAGLKLLLAAPTGRAAKRMTEATQREAKTIHRLLEYQYNEDEGVLNFNKTEDAPLEADVVIIDEVSMIDIVLMMHLTNAIMPKTRLILVGDSDQLPSVGPGNVLRNLIDSNSLKTTRLNQIYRQDEKSLIAVNAHRINQGEMPILNEKDKDFYFVQGRTQAEIGQGIRNLCAKRLPDYYGFDALKAIQVLTPVKNSPIGTHALNHMLQEALNPPHKDKNERKFGDRLYRVGDKVMQIKNNYTISWRTDFDTEGEGVFNGDIGFITSIDEQEKRVHVLFDDERYVQYEYTQLDELVHAYAVTVHKSQGSEFPVVVMPMTWCAPMLMNRNILYTAITRAKQLVVLVGEERYVKMMMDNLEGGKRHSGLDVRIRMLADMEQAMETPKVDL